jgi:hypothetical protein
MYRSSPELRVLSPEHGSFRDEESIQENRSRRNSRLPPSREAAARGPDHQATRMPLRAKPSSRSSRLATQD